MKTSTLSKTILCSVAITALQQQSGIGIEPTGTPAAPEPVSLAAAFEQARLKAKPDADNPDHWTAENPQNGLHARFTPEGLTLEVSTPDANGRTLRRSTAWRTRSIGYGDKLSMIPEGEVQIGTAPSLQNRVEIIRPEMVEWFINRKEGLEHGWTLFIRPPGGGTGLPLRLELTLEGDLTAEVIDGGNDVVLRDKDGVETLRYERLKVWDAEGKPMISRMLGGGRSLAVEVEDGRAVYPLTIDPVFSQEAYLKASNTGAGDQFGHCVAIDGSTAVIGAPSDNSAATGVNGNQTDSSLSGAGAAYVFVHGPSGWTQQAYLKASNTGSSDNFGSSVAIEGETIVVGAFYESSNSTGVNGNQSNNSASGAGAVYVFTRDGTTWTQQAYLKASNTEAYDTFGASVGISGDTLVVGAQTEDGGSTGVNGIQTNGAGNSGAAYVFHRNGTIWTQQAYLKASNTGFEDFFGTSVAISGNTIAVGAPGEDSNSTGINGNQSNNSSVDAGAVYVFVRSGSIWTQQAYVKASDAGSFDYASFGASVAIDGDTLVAGSPGEGSRSAYAFVRNGSSWTQQAHIPDPFPYANDRFGNSVAIKGDIIALGAPLEESNGVTDSGAVYTYAREGSTWSQQSYLWASTTGPGDRFGTSVALDGEALIVGASYEDSIATGVNGDQENNSSQNSGAAYTFLLGESFSTNPDSSTVISTGGVHSFGIFSGGTWSWSVSGGSGWFSSEEAFTQAGNQTFTFAVESNISTSPRVATITFVSGTQVSTHVITQQGSAASPIVSISGSLDFGSVPIGNTETRTLTLRNDGNSALTVSSLSYPEGFTGNWTSGIIPAGQSRLVTVSFTPSRLGGYGGSVTASSNATAGVDQLAVSGFGIAPPPPPTIRVARSKGFPATRIGRSSRPQKVILTNPNPLPLSGIRARIAGRLAREFKATQPAPGTLKPGASAFVSITFKPRGRGLRKATLILSSVGPSASVQLSGRGKK